MSELNANVNNDSSGSANEDVEEEGERGVGDCTFYQHPFSERRAHWTHSHVDEKRHPSVQAAMILEAGIRTTEHLEMDTLNQHSYVLKMCKGLLKQMVSSDVVSGVT